MSQPNTTTDAKGDDGVSPMEAQDIGPGKTGPGKTGRAEPPLRQEKPGEPSDARDPPDTPMKPGGEDGTRDDL